MTHTTTLFGLAFGAPDVPLWAVLVAGCATTAIPVWVLARSWSPLARRLARTGCAVGLACACGAGFAPIAASGWLAAAALVLCGLPAALGAVRGARGPDPAAQAHALQRLRILDAAVNASRDGLLVTARDADAVGLRIVYANPAFEELTGYGTDEAVGQSPSVLYSESAPDEREVAHAALRLGVPTQFEVRARRKDGSRVWVEWNVVPVSPTFAGGDYQIAILRDVTERKRLEDQLRQSAKMEAIGQLAAGVAHDFNNLLTVIGGNTELLSDLVRGVPGAPPLVEQVQFASERAGWLVRQLLMFSRRREPKRAKTDLVRAVADIAGLLRRLIGARIDTEVAVPDRPVFVTVDRGQLEQALINLAVNARDAMPAGGRLRVAVEPTETAVALRVSDTGHGMSAAVQARIFEPFFTTKSPEKGTGLGLATVFEFVQQSGGSVTVDSTPGVGTCFRIVLPLGAGAAPAPTPAQPAPSACGACGACVASGSVLVAEDESGVRQLASAVLTSDGYSVTAVEDGAQALALLQSGQVFDAVLTDLCMPGAGGEEVATAARAACPTVGIVFMSGYTESEPAVPGAVYVQKPFTPTALTDAVRAARTARRSGAQLAASV